MSDAGWFRGGRAFDGDDLAGGRVVDDQGRRGRGAIFDRRESRFHHRIQEFGRQLAQHVGEPRGRERVDLDAETRQFERKSEREPDDATLRRGVRGEAGNAVHARARRNVHDATPPRLLHPGNELADQVHRPGQVHREAAVPLFVGQPGDCAANRDRSVVHEHVDGSHLFPSTATELAHCIEVGYLRGDTHGVRQFRCDRRDFGNVAPVDDHAGALGGEPLGDRTANTARGPRHQRTVSGEQAHHLAFRP